MLGDSHSLFSRPFKMDMTTRSANTQVATGASDYSMGHAIAVAESFIRGLQAATNISTLETQQQLILLHLYGRGEVVQTELILATGVGKSSVSRNVDRLGRGEWLRDPDCPGKKKHVPGLGLVTSEPNPQNRKSNLVTLTPLGQQMLDNIATAVSRQFNIVAK